MYKFLKDKHIHTLRGKPLMGTTSVIKAVLPPPLAWWGSGMALEPMGWTNPKKVKKEKGIEHCKNFLDWLEDEGGYTPEGWYDFLQECYRNHDNFKKQRATEGTDSHALVEDAVKEAIRNNGGFLRPKYENEEVERFATWGRGKRFLYSEVHVFSELLWLGGVVDLVYEEEGFYLADYKTSKAIYPSHFIQQGLYDAQQSENGFFAPGGERLSAPLDIQGYTVITSKGEAKTYRGTKQLKDFSSNLVQMYKTLKELEVILK